MQQLNLPLYNFRIKNQNNKVLIFDSQRKKYVTLTPEEWVRQNFIHFLITELHYPASYIAVEKQLLINGLKKRCDAIIYNNMAQPIVIVEFKAPNITINQEVFDQAAVYNSKLNIDYFIISNGLNHFCCKIDRIKSKYLFLSEIPNFETLSRSLLNPPKGT